MALPQIENRHLVEGSDLYQSKSLSKSTSSIYTQSSCTSSQLFNTKPAHQSTKKVKPKPKKKCCQRCLYELRPSQPSTAEKVYLPPIASGHQAVANQTEMVGREEAFMDAINSLSQANRATTPSLNQSWDTDRPRSNASSAQFFPSLQYPTPSYYSSYDSLYSGPSNGKSINSKTTTKASDVAPVPNNVYIPLESLLASGDSKLKVTIRCSKYNEIGNPHARKRKSRKQAPTDFKKWNWNASFTKHGLSQDLIRKEKQNFMDKQSGSIYNSYEKAKIDLTLTPRGRLNAPKIKPVPLLPYVGVTTMGNITDNRFLLNQLLRSNKKLDKYECKIPTIPISLGAGNNMRSALKPVYISS